MTQNIEVLTPSTLERYATETLPHQQSQKCYQISASDTDIDKQSKRFFRESMFVDPMLMPFSQELSLLPLNRDLIANIHKLPNSANLSHIHRYLWKAIIRGRDVVTIDKVDSMLRRTMNR
jgi:hypothetical protein